VACHVSESGKYVVLESARGKNVEVILKVISQGVVFLTVVNN
jgi:hypothetical protein